jgi:1-acyl-sn-glycerol-3-phosphate acyltransferase
MRAIGYHLFYWTVSIVCVTTHFLVGCLCLFTPHPMRYNRAASRLFIRIIVWSMGINLTITGQDDIPTNTPCIFMANHTSLLDILVMACAIPIHFNFIAKKELIWAPLIGIDLIMAGDFLIDRSNPRKAKACLDKVAKRLQQGGSVLIFPEGTRSQNGDLLPFKRGAFKLAKKSGATVVPCYIHGTSSIVKKKSLLASKGNVQLSFAHPISSQNIDVDTLHSATYQAIEGMQKR